MKNNIQKYAWLLLFCFAFCCVLSCSAPAAEKVSQIIQGDNYESLKAAFDREICSSQKHLNRAKELEKKYPKDPRPAENRRKWEDHIALCQVQFFTVLKEIFKPEKETKIEASTVNELREEYRRRTGIIDKRLKILSDLSKKYPSHDTKELVSKLQNFRQSFRDTRYSCPQHESFCRKCISREEPCKACGGDGKWGFWGWKCKLCRGTGTIYAPKKTYCPHCKGRWDEGSNCNHCNYGLVSCPSHDVSKTICQNCKTEDGNLSGQSLEQ